MHGGLNPRTSLLPDSKACPQSPGKQAVEAELLQAAARGVSSAGAPAMPVRLRLARYGKRVRPCLLLHCQEAVGTS